MACFEFPTSKESGPQVFMKASPLRWEWLYGSCFRIAAPQKKTSTHLSTNEQEFSCCDTYLQAFSLTAYSREHNTRENVISSTLNHHGWEANAKAEPPGKRLDLERSWQICLIFWHLRAKLFMEKLSFRITLAPFLKRWGIKGKIAGKAGFLCFVWHSL